MVTWAELRGIDVIATTHFSIGDEVVVAFGLHLADQRPGTKVAVSLRAIDGTPLAHVVDDDSGFALGRERNDWRVTVRFKDIRLYPGSYLVSIWAVNSANTEVFDHVEDCLELTMVDGGRLTMRRLPRAHGFLFLTPEWDAQPHAASAPVRVSRSSRRIHP